MKSDQTLGKPDPTPAQVTAINEALLIAGLRQHELAETAEKLNAELRAEMSERKRMEEALRQSEKRFRVLFNLGPIAAYSCDASGMIREYNDRAAELWGRQPQLGDISERFCGSFRLFLQNGSHLPHDQCPMADVLTGKIPGVTDAEVMIERPNGSRIIAIVNIAPLKDEDGNIIGSINCFYDVTLRKMAEMALRDAQTTVERANELLRSRAKHLEALVDERTVELRETVQHLETFSYSIVHDMRAPLRSMGSFASILKAEYHEKLEVPARDYLERITASASRMDTLITDVLAYSTTAMGKINQSPVDIDKIVTGMVEQYPEFQIHSEAIRIIHPLPLVLGNAALLTQVFSNLLDNALKFMPPGCAPNVVVRAEKCGRDILPGAAPGASTVIHGLARGADNHFWGTAKPGWVRIWVEDNGIGIAREHWERIFGLFHRLHTSKEFSGTGVGLAIVKKAVERMGGTVGLESEPGKGSHFWFELKQAE